MEDHIGQLTLKDGPESGARISLILPATLQDDVVPTGLM
jgi:nitrogen fixation/metabolism regulation signal transduction histidine kinase